MRMQRLLISLLTAALIGLVPIGFASSAEAAAKPKRYVSATGKDLGRRYVMKGRVKPGKKIKILVQQRVGKSKKWKFKKAIRANRYGKYSFYPQFGKRGVRYCYRFVIPGNKRFKRTYRGRYTFGAVEGRRMCVVTRAV